MEHRKKWDEPICKPGELIELELGQWPQLIVMTHNQAASTHGKVISDLLDRQIVITNKRTGQVLYICSIMELALQRLRAADLEHKPKPEPIKLGLHSRRYRFKCAEGHRFLKTTDNDTICQLCGGHFGNHQELDTNRV